MIDLLLCHCRFIRLDSRLSRHFLNTLYIRHQPQPQPNQQPDFPTIIQSFLDDRHRSVFWKHKTKNIIQKRTHHTFLPRNLNFYQKKKKTNLGLTLLTLHPKLIKEAYHIHRHLTHTSRIYILIKIPCYIIAINMNKKLLSVF